MRGLHYATMLRMIRTLTRSLLIAGALLATGAAMAQTEATRIVVAPLQGPAELAPWQLAIPATLQRSLNTVPGVYVPPIGDPVVLADQSSRVDADTPTEILTRFSADAFLAGNVADAGDGLTVTLERYGADGTRAESTLDVPRDPRVALPALAGAALDLLALDVDGAQRATVLDVAGQSPSVEGLQVAALASSRLAPPDLPRLQTAHELAPESSWLNAELARAESLRGNHDEAMRLAETATTLLENDVEAWTVRGVVEARAGNDEVAATAFRRALSINPRHAVAQAGLGSLTTGDDAVQAFEAAIETYPRLVEAHLGLANEVGGARALQVLRSATRALPESVTLHAAILTRAIAAGDSAGATSYLRDTLEEPMSQAPGVYALAGELPTESREAALAILDEGSQRYPENVRIAIAHARLLRLDGDPASAEGILAPLVSQAPNDPALANAYALTLVAQERIEEARSILEAAAGRSSTVRFNLAKALIDTGRAREAADELAPDMTEANEDPEAWALYGTALAGSGQLDEARTALDRALTLNPDQALARQTLRRLEERTEIAGDVNDPLTPEARAAFDRGMSLLEQGRNDEAVAEFTFAYERNEEEAPLLAFYLANALQRAGDARAAIDLYDEALGVFPGSSTILNNLGFAWLQLGRYDQALPALRDAVAANDANARAYLNLGLTYYGLSRFADAIEAWDRATELDASLAPAIAASRERAQRQLDGTAP